MPSSSKTQNSVISTHKEKVSNWMEQTTQTHFHQLSADAKMLKRNELIAFAIWFERHLKIQEFIRSKVQMMTSIGISQYSGKANIVCKPQKFRKTLKEVKYLHFFRQS